MRHRADSEVELSNVLDSIHGVATKDVSWVDALERICNFVGARAADLNFLEPKSGTYSRIVPVRFDTEGLARYAEAYTRDPLNTNPRLPFFGIKEESSIWADSDIWSPREREKLSFFGELVHPYFGVHDALNTWIRKSQDDRADVALLLHYGKHDGGPSEEARRRLRLILPHLRRACTAEELLAEARAENVVLIEAFDRIPQAVALVDKAGRIVRANQAATKILARSEGITLALDERLVFADNTARDAFSRAVAQCSGTILVIEDQPSADASHLYVPRKDRSPLSLTLQPLPRSRVGESRAIAILFISDPDSALADQTASLRAAYGLSPTESRLVQALSIGISLKEFAQQNIMSYETARSHMRRVFLKTGSRKQADLVRIAHRLHWGVP